MMAEKVSFKTKTVVREMLFSGYFAGQLDKESLISRLEISMRQFYRLSKKFCTTNSLAHGLCGKSSNRSKDICLKTKVLSLYKDTYNGCNYEHFKELLLEDEGIKLVLMLYVDGF